MQPYDRERQDESDEEWEAVDRRLALTDDDVKVMGLKEYKPGYYFNDPRYPSIGPEIRYLLDHTAAPWIERRPSAPSPRIVPLHHPKKGQPAWDDEQFSGTTFEGLDAAPISIPAQPPRCIQPTSSEIPHSVLVTAPRKMRTTPYLWLCQVCRSEQALWPREISWQWIVWGLRLSLVLRSPYVCTQCRIMRFTEQRSIGKREHRPFWNAVLTLVTGDSMTDTPVVIKRITTWRQYWTRWLRRWCS